MRKETGVRVLRSCLGVALVLAVALAAGGCAYCPGCYVLNQGFRALTGSDMPCHSLMGGGKAKEAQKPGPQTACPVMGGKINKELFVDHAGKRIYACCEGCLPKIRKDPAKYIKQLEDAGVVLDKTPDATQ